MPRLHGALCGIGEACARRLAGVGARVTVADRDADGAKRVAGEIGGDAWVVDLGPPGYEVRTLATTAADSGSNTSV